MPPRAVRTEAARSFVSPGFRLAAPFVSATLPLLLLAACAGAPAGAGSASAVSADASQPPGLRLLVRLAPGLALTTDTASIAAWASDSAGSPVRHVAAAGAAWHALALQCRPADCDAAVQRLAADTRHFDSVERDPVRRAAR